jgi:hypothetical protein
MQGRGLEPTLPAAGPSQGHGVNLHDPLLPPPPHSSAAFQGQGDPVAKKESSLSMRISREKSQTPMDSRMSMKSPVEHIHPSSSSASGQPHTHSDSATYSDIPTRSRTEPSHSEPTRQEGGRQIGDGGRQGGGISRRTTEAIHPAPTKALSSLPDQLSSKASSGPASLLDSPARKSRDMPASSGDRTTRKEGMGMSKICHFSLSLIRRFARKSRIVAQACRFEHQNLLSQPQTPRDMGSTFVTRRRLPVLLQHVKVKVALWPAESLHQA